MRAVTEAGPPLPDASALFAPLTGRWRVGLAVSGGSDSLALMLLAQRWATGTKPRPALFVYTVDHGLRPEAAAEAQMVAREATALGLAVRVLRWDGYKPETGVQEAAREARYRLIGAAMQADGAEILVTGHHRDDQAETVLMRLAHGSGLRGLAGMTAFSEVEGINVFRPLLDIDPAALHELVVQAGFTPAVDPGNANRDYERVRWRQLLPALAELGLDSPALGRFAARMREADAALTEIALAAFDETVTLDGFGAARIAQPVFSRLSPAIGTRVLQRVLDIVGGRRKPRALSQVERLRDTLAQEGMAALTLLGCVLRADGESVTVAREPGRMSLPRHRLGPHSEVLWDDRFVIRNTSGEASFSVGTVPHVDRRKLTDFLGFRVTAPAEAIRTAPIVRDVDDSILALGGWSFDERVAVELLLD